LVPLGISRGELSSRVREFLRRLGREGIERLSRGEFARAVGVDPLTLPSEYKRELARVMYQEFGLPYRKVCELLAMSARDVARAVRGGAGTGGTVGGPAVSEVSVELQARAIELVRSGEARNPNDLALKLRIPLDVAEQLFDRVVKNEKLTVEPTIDAAVRIEKSLRSIKQYVEKLREFEEKIKEYEERAKNVVKGLDEALNDRMKTVQHIEKRVEELGREIFGLGITLTASGVEVRIVLDLLKRVRRLEEELGKLKKEVKPVE
jgi:archaellum component FlaC